MKFNEFVDTIVTKSKNYLINMGVSNKERYFLEDSLDQSAIKIIYELNMSCLLGMITQTEENGKSIVTFKKPSPQNTSVLKTYVENYLIVSLLSTHVLDNTQIKDLNNLINNIKENVDNTNLEI